MNIAFITREKMSYDEAPPSRILNISRILEKYHNVIILAQKSGKIKNDNIYEIPRMMGGFVGNQIFKIMMVICSLYNILAKKIDFIITREYYFVLMLYPFAKLFGSKILYDMHCFRYKELEFEGKHIKSLITKPFEKLSHRLPYKILAISNGIIEDLPQELRNKTILLPNGVDLEWFTSTKTDDSLMRKYNIKKDTPIIGFVGNWMDWVDVPTFIQASEYVKNASFVVIGEGYETKDVTYFKKNYPNVVFTGRIDHAEAIKLLKFMDICVLPYKKAEVVKHLSIRKTFEYMAAGKPIIICNSNLFEKSFLKENLNMISYKTEDTQDLSNKINYLLSNKKLMKTLSINNKKLSQQFSWEKIIQNSDLLIVIDTYFLQSPIKISKGTISIIIKALNEEEHINDCIKSALSAIKGLKGEIILVDSKSSDKTINLAKRYPIKILQLVDENERRCGIGPQIGFLYSKGDYIYILDGDMVIAKDFIRKTLPYFNYDEIAGVGGNIIEKSKENLVFQVRSKYNQVQKVTKVHQLGMGGIYKREAIEKVGYFSNPYFFAYEEYDLGAKLLSKGYKMIRIPENMVEHYGDETTSFETLKSKWKSRYFFGSGQYLKASIKNKHFFSTLNELKIYVLTLIWILFGVISVISLMWSFKFFLVYSFVTFIILALLLIRKHNINKLIFSISSWDIQSLGMILGFFLKYRNPLQYKPHIRVIK